MKENFIIKTGTLDYDEDIDELNIYYYKQRINYFLMIAGAVLVLYAVL
jgi:hypothetical protein